MSVPLFIHAHAYDPQMETITHVNDPLELETYHRGASPAKYVPDADVSAKDGPSGNVSTSTAGDCTSGSDAHATIEAGRADTV
jgi:hypothetical protein